MSSFEKPANPILLAAAKGEPAIVSAILAHRIAPKIDLNERDENGVSTLGYLLQKNHNDLKSQKEAILAMIALGAKLDVLEPDFDTRTDWDSAANIYRHQQSPLLNIAIRKNSVALPNIVDALGPKKINDIAKDSPLLHTALSMGNREVAEAILKAGAEPNQHDKFRGFPIASACNPACFSLMVASGAKLNLADEKGKTALQAICGSNASQEILSMATSAAQAEAKGQVAMFQEGKAADKSKASDEIAQPLIEALFESIDRKKTDRIKNLWLTLGLGRDKTRLFNSRDKKGRTLAHAAVSAKNFALLKRLAERGMDLNTFDEQGNTPISILLGLEFDRSTERGDRYGDRRKKLFSDLSKHIRWDATSPEGFTYFDSLFTVGIERKNGMTPEEVKQKACAEDPLWLDSPAGDGTCLLSRCLARSVVARSAPYNSISSVMENSTKGICVVLAEQISKPEFGKYHAKAVLDACFSDKQRSSWSYPSGLTRSIAETVEKNIEAFKATGMDPESVAWCSSLASSVPTLFAAIESWRLAGVSASATNVRAKSKSL